MNIDEVQSRLCYYDTRNPNGVIDDMTPVELIEMGIGPMARPGCYCDNCFSGRTELANIIVEWSDHPEIQSHQHSGCHKSSIDL